MKPWLTDPDCQLWHGDARKIALELAGGSVRSIITSPPYFGLRDYGEADQIGLEPDLATYVLELRALFDLLWPVLADDGTLWLNLGDSYSSDSSGKRYTGMNGRLGRKEGRGHQELGQRRRPASGAAKQLAGVPWRVAFALQDAGWILRSGIVWEKPDAMPESVKDRPTMAHEFVFLFAKQQRYRYNRAALLEPHSPDGRHQTTHVGDTTGTTAHANYANRVGRERWPGEGRNARTVWRIATEQTSEEHYAAMPRELARRCILAGTDPGDTVLDPFAGTATTCLVARQLARRSIGIDVSQATLEIAARRLGQQSLEFA